MRCTCHPRGGHSLLEMLVTLVIGGIVIAAVGAVGFRQQRFQRDIVAVVERLEQLEQATELVPITVRGVSAGDGDIARGGARDTSLEFRATIATAIVCDTSRGTLVLAPTATEAPRLASILARPDVGDTLWVLTVAGSSESWIAHPIAAVVDSVSTCKLVGTSPWLESAGRKSLAVRIGSASGVGPGTPVRITRPWRYSIYKSSDGDWYLGGKDWNSGSMRFNTIQPVSGPFRSAASRGLTFRYLDTAGAVIPSGAADTHGIALIQVAFRVDSALDGHFAHAIGVGTQPVASFALRNR